jgi:hypothetical protein
MITILYKGGFFECETVVVERKHGLFVLGLWGRCGRGVRQGTRAVRGMTDMSNQDDGILGGVGN